MRCAPVHARAAVASAIVTDPDEWPQSRRHAATEHAAAQRRAREAEAAQARAVIATFVESARARGLPTTPLRARGYDGRSTYRTGLSGWPLHTDGRMAIGADGEFYLLSVPTSWRSRLFGVQLEPADPPLQVGRSAGDGESISLAELLQRSLDATG
jgi:hypothetical protein